MIQILVKTLTGSIVPISTDTSHTVGQLKARLQEQLRPTEDLEPRRQKLVFRGRELEDNQALGYYEMQDEDVVHLIIRPPPEEIQVIVVHMQGRRTVLEIKPSEKVSALKNRLYEMEGTEPRLQKLLFNGEDLMDDRTLSSYNIKSASTIQSVLRTVGGHD